MNWVLVFVVLVGAAAVYKIITSIRKNRELHAEDWDSKLITELRKRGQDPFQPHDVDFFFALPNEAACTAINQALEAEGFRVDVKAVPDDKEYPFSLHATKNMRVHAPEMKEYSRRFKLLATTHAGRYDGWGST
jgi:hypothetical protein